MINTLAPNSVNCRTTLRLDTSKVGLNVAGHYRASNQDCGAVDRTKLDFCHEGLEEQDELGRVIGISAT